MVVSVNVVRYELVLYAGSGSRCEHDVRSSSTSQHGSHPSAGLGSHCGTGCMDVLWSLWSVMLMCMYLCKPVRTSKRRSLSILSVIIIIIMVALCRPNRADHYIFVLWFLLLLSSFFLA